MSQRSVDLVELLCLAILRHTLRHAEYIVRPRPRTNCIWGKGNSQVKECELARGASVLIDEAAGQVAAEDGANITLRDLQNSVSKDIINTMGINK